MQWVRCDNESNHHTIESLNIKQLWVLLSRDLNTRPSITNTNISCWLIIQITDSQLGHHRTVLVLANVIMHYQHWSCIVKKVFEHTVEFHTRKLEVNVSNMIV